MAYRKFLIFLLALCALPAFAGYAQLAAPSGWSGGSQAMMQGAKEMIVRGASNAPYFMTQPSIQVAGKAVTVPAALRFSANAGRFLAAQAFGYPALFLAAGGFAYAYYTSQNFQVAGGVWQRVTSGTSCSSGCLKYKEVFTDTYYLSEQAAANATLSEYQKRNDGTFSGVVYVSSIQSLVNHVLTIKVVYKVVVGGDTGTARTWSTTIASASTPPYDTTSMTPATRPEFESTMENAPIPAGAPEGWPMALPPLPVEVPRINPDPLPWAVPSPAQQPLRVPVGDPVPVSPATDPQTYKSPVIDIVPSPTLDSPWRVDLQPRDVIKTDPAPLPEKAPVPAPTASSPATPTSEKTPGLCELYPDILACAKPDLDTPQQDELKTKDIPVTVTPDGGWGGGGSCPAPRHLAGANVDFTFTGFCDFFTGIRPVLLAVAWLSAALILIGAKGSES